MTVWPEETSIPEEDDDHYPCLDEESCGSVCVGDCYPPNHYGEEAAYL